MAAPRQLKTKAPYTASLDTTTSTLGGLVRTQVTVKLVGTVANVQADWATLKAVNLFSASALIDWS